jgi:hypothetical protein
MILHKEKSGGESYFSIGLFSDEAGPNRGPQPHLLAWAKKWPKNAQLILPPCLLGYVLNSVRINTVLRPKTMSATHSNSPTFLESATAKFSAEH